MRLHLLPFFDDRTVDSITTKDVELHKAYKLRTTKLKPATINNHLVVLRKQLVTPMERELILAIPVFRRLNVRPAPCDWLNTEVSCRFLGAIDQHSPRWHAVFWTALRTRLRRGELFALHWDDVDLVARTLTVNRPTALRSGCETRLRRSSQPVGSAGESRKPEPSPAYRPPVTGRGSRSEGTDVADVARAPHPLASQTAHGSTQSLQRQPATRRHAFAQSLQRQPATRLTGGRGRPRGR